MSDRQEPDRDEIERVRHTFSSQERYVLINLAEQILELLGQSSVSRDPLHDIVGISGNELPPDDPVLKRLLPSAYTELQDAAEFRRYTEDALRDRKRAHAHRVREMLLDLEGRFEVGASKSSQGSNDPTGEGIDVGMVFVHGESEVQLSALKMEIVGEDLWAWLGALNDIRLALAVRLDIGGPTMGDLPNDAHRVASSPGREGLTNEDESSNAGNSSQEAIQRKYELMTESDPMKAVYAVYSWLGWLQEDFLKQMEEPSSDRSDPSQHQDPTP
jgi:hypothetical protein